MSARTTVSGKAIQNNRKRQLELLNGKESGEVIVRIRLPDPAPDVLAGIILSREDLRLAIEKMDPWTLQCTLCSEAATVIRCEDHIHE